MNPISATILPCYPPVPAAAMPDCLAGQPEIFILTALAKGGLAPFLPYKPILPAILPKKNVLSYTFSNHYNLFLPPPPHPKTAKSGKKRQKMATLKPFLISIENMTALITAPEQYKQEYKRSIENPEGFCTDIGIIYLPCLKSRGYCSSILTGFIFQTEQLPFFLPQASPRIHQGSGKRRPCRLLFVLSRNQ